MKQMSVNSSFNLKVPKALILHSCNLQVGKPIGQGIKMETTRDLIRCNDLQGSLGLCIRGYWRLHSMQIILKVWLLKPSKVINQCIITFFIIATLLGAGFIDKHLVKELLRECSKMIHFDHPNVIKLRGVCLDGGPAPYIIMPFMPNGSLLSFLKENRDSIVIDPDTSSGESDTVRM